MLVPRLSVLMPVFNAAVTVGAAIESVLENTFTEFEFVIVDDGSTDRTPEVLQSVQDPRIRLFYRDQNDFINTLNFATQQCRAPVIARMDSDDLCSPDRFQLQLDLMNQSGADIVGGCVKIVDGNQRASSAWQRYEQWINNHLDSESISALRFVESPIVNPSAMAKREVFELGYREGDFPEDYDLWLRALHQGFRAVKTPEIVLRWVDGQKRLTRSHSRYSREAFDRCRREHLLKGPLKNVDDVILWGAGQTGKPWLRWLQSEGIRVKSVVDVDPGKIGQEIHGVPVISPEELRRGDGTPLVAAVGAEGARELITDHVKKLGYRIGRDVWFVA